MHNHNSFEERIDKLAMFYIEKHYDISSMSVDEFIKTFNDVCNNIVNSIQTTK